MALTGTLGQLMVNDVLPEDMRDYRRVLDKKGVNGLLSEIAEKHPERYREISFRLGRIGREAAYTTGGNSFGLKHLRRSRIARARREKLQRQIDAILDNDNLDDDKRNQLIQRTMGEVMGQERDEIVEESLAEGNPLALQLKGAGRGNKVNLSSLRGSDGLYQDHRNRIIPIPVLRSYSQGLSPAEYWAGTYGARQGVMCLAGETKVLMADYSEKEIARIRVGDMVMGADLTGVFKPVTVTRTYNQGNQPCYRYRFRKGSCRNVDTFRELVATEEHKVLAQRREGRTGVYAHLSIYDSMPLPLKSAVIRANPTKNTFVAIPAKGCDEDDTVGQDVPQALIAGVMLGDGCMAPSTRGNYSISCADDLMLQDLDHELEQFSLSLKKAQLDESQYGWVLVGEDGKTHRDNPLKLWLRDSLGEKLAHEKTFPEGFYTWCRRDACRLLGGLLSSDVSITERKDGCTVKLSLTSRALAADTQQYLERRLGVWTSALYLVPKEDGHRTQYAFQITHPEAVRRFAELVPLVGCKKYELRQALRYESKDPANQCEMGFKLLDREPVGTIPTYDIEVDCEHHLFVLANGLVVSNSTKFATQDAGYLSKQLNQIAHRLLVTDQDSDSEPDTIRGYPVDVDDADNEGALLAADIGGYKRNTVLTPKILRHLRRKGVNRMLVRSPISYGSPDGGLYARDVGIREFGGLSARGENVGLTAAQALSEPISQSQLSAKHTGGVAGESKGVSGFDYINQMVQVPRTFRGGAAHAGLDGVVQAIEKAPAGGHYVTIENEKHYVGAGYPVLVKPGQKVEAGDVISKGTPNPALVVKHKGVGEGRRYFVKAFRDAIRDAGMSAHRRNIEILARGLINHVRLTDEVGDFAPDDVVPYNVLESSYQPREGFKSVEPRAAVGQYLERPYLHYSIGTKIKPSMLRDFTDFGVTSVDVHGEAPPFQAEMIRGAANLQHDPDWQTRMFGSGLKGSVLRATQRGGTSDERGTSFVPGRARAVDFGRSGGPVMNPKRNLHDQSESGYDVMQIGSEGIQ